ncbi:MAG: hypothetical protein ACJARD_000714 [Alphaproteobacteria bacterium]|jgi:hypothetical protein
MNINPKTPSPTRLQGTSYPPPLVRAAPLTSPVANTTAGPPLPINNSPTRTPSPARSQAGTPIRSDASAQVILPPALARAVSPESEQAGGVAYLEVSRETASQLTFFDFDSSSTTETTGNQTILQPRFGHYFTQGTGQSISEGDQTPDLGNDSSFLNVARMPSTSPSEEESAVSDEKPSLMIYRPVAQRARGIIFKDLGKSTLSMVNLKNDDSDEENSNNVLERVSLESKPSEDAEFMPTSALDIKKRSRQLADSLKNRHNVLPADPHNLTGNYINILVGSEEATDDCCSSGCTIL